MSSPERPSPGRDVGARVMRGVLEDLGLLHLIVGNLQRRDMAKVARTCRLWSQVAREKQLVLVEGRLTPQQVVSQAKRGSRHVEFLHLKGDVLPSPGRPLSAAFFTAALWQMAGLRELVLDGVKLTSSSLDCLAQPSCAPLLQHLTLTSSGGLGLEVDMTLKHARLAHLVITKCNLRSLQLQLPAAQELSLGDSLVHSVMQDLPGLQSLSVREFRTSGLQTLLTSLTSLTRLAITSCQMVLQEICPRLPLLAELDLTGSKHPALTALPHCPSLRVLRLNDCCTVHQTSISALLQSNSQLLELHLERCPDLVQLRAQSLCLQLLVLTGCRHLSSLTLLCPALTTLKLGPEAPGGALVGPSLTCASLTSVTLHSEAITSIAWAQLPRLRRLILGCPNLTHLALDECPELQPSLFTYLSDGPPPTIPPSWQTSGSGEAAKGFGAGLGEAGPDQRQGQPSGSGCGGGGSWGAGSAQGGALGGRGGDGRWREEGSSDAEDEGPAEDGPGGAGGGCRVRVKMGNSGSAGHIRREAGSARPEESRGREVSGPRVDIGDVDQSRHRYVIVPYFDSGAAGPVDPGTADPRAASWSGRGGQVIPRSSRPRSDPVGQRQGGAAGAEGAAGAAGPSGSGGSAGVSEFRWPPLSRLTQAAGEEEHLGNRQRGGLASRQGALEEPAGGPRPGSSNQGQRQGRRSLTLLFSRVPRHDSSSSSPPSSLPPSSHPQPSARLPPNPPPLPQPDQAARPPSPPPAAAAPLTPHPSSTLTPPDAWLAMSEEAALAAAYAPTPEPSSLAPAPLPPLDVTLPPLDVTLPPPGFDPHHAELHQMAQLLGLYHGLMGPGGGPQPHPTPTAGGSTGLGASAGGAAALGGAAGTAGSQGVGLAGVGLGGGGGSRGEGGRARGPFRISMFTSVGAAGPAGAGATGSSGSSEATGSSGAGAAGAGAAIRPWRSRASLDEAIRSSLHHGTPPAAPPPPPAPGNAPPPAPALRPLSRTPPSWDVWIGPPLVPAGAAAAPAAAAPAAAPSEPGAASSSGGGSGGGRGGPGSCPGPQAISRAFLERQLERRRQAEQRSGGQGDVARGARLGGGGEPGSESGSQAAASGGPGGEAWGGALWHDYISTLDPPEAAAVVRALMEQHCLGQAGGPAALPEPAAARAVEGGRGAAGGQGEAVKDLPFPVGAPRLRVLSVTHCVGLGSACLAHPHLHALTLTGCLDLACCVLHCPQLRALQLEQCTALSGLELQGGALERLTLGEGIVWARLDLPTLTALGAQGCCKLQSADLAGCSSLSSLDMSLCGTLQQQVLTSLSQAQLSLTTLSLSGSLSMAGCSQVHSNSLRLLAALPALTDLDLSFNDITEVDALAAAVPHLTRLNLAACCLLAPDSLMQLLPGRGAERGLPALVHLDVSGCALKPHHVAGLMGQVTQLTALIMNGCPGVTNTLWLDLQQQQQQGSQLTSLSLACCKQLQVLSLGLQPSSSSSIKVLKQWQYDALDAVALQQEVTELAWQPAPQLPGSLPLLPHLTSLRLGWSALQVLALALPRLTHLQVDGCQQLRVLELRCPLLLVLHAQSCSTLRLAHLDPNVTRAMVLKTSQTAQGDCEEGGSMDPMDVTKC